MRLPNLGVLPVAVLLLSVPASAVDVAITVGVSETLVMPKTEHGGLYPAVGLAWIVPAGPVTLSPGIAVEWSPEFARDGLVLSLFADKAVSERIGIDLGVSLMHDQPEFRLAESGFYAGAAAGFSVFLGPWTLSPSVGAFLGLNQPGWALLPGVLFARTL